MFESLRITDWSAIAPVRSNSIVLAQTTDTSKVANFGGMYTYDAIAGNTAPGWANASAFCRANGLVWAPSIGPGYLDDRAVPGNTTPTLGRENGATYDRQWTNALQLQRRRGSRSPRSTSGTRARRSSRRAPTRPPATATRPTPAPTAPPGAASETAYLDRTKYWVDRFNPPAPTADVSLRARVNSRYVAAENAGAAPLIANRTAVGPWEQFERDRRRHRHLIALRPRANGRYRHGANGAAPLIANATAIGPAETFQVIRNSDGSVTLRALGNNRYVAAENAGAAPLIANRTAIGSWERFDLLTT